MVVLDASVWISALLPDEADHLTSYAWITSWIADGRTFDVPDLFPVEVASAMARRDRDPNSGLRALLGVQAESSVRVVVIRSAVWTSAAEIAANLLLRGADAVYVALAAELGIPLITWEQELLTKAVTVVDVRTPEGLPI